MVVTSGFYLVWVCDVGGICSKEQTGDESEGRISACSEMWL